jgi:fructose-1,6-bisphosphatase/inositol monophosphatase family enzyme
MTASRPFVLSGDRLHLPVWPNGDYHTAAMAHDRISVPVSPAFWLAFHTHPGEAAPQIEQVLRQIVPVFMALAFVGQGVAASHEKSAPDDIVTEVDLGLEGLFRLWISTHFPKDYIIGEEGNYAGMSVTATPAVWIIDPIDGTSNYSEGSPNVVIQLCRLKNGEPDLAVMGFPFYGVLETASFGGSVEMLKRWRGPVPVADAYCIATEYRDDRKNEDDTFLAMCDILAGTPYRLKSIGVTIYTLLYHVDFVFYKPRIKVWDMYPPLALLRLRGVPVDMSLYVFDGSGYRWVDPFSRTAYDLLWRALENEGRIGHVLLVPSGEKSQSKTVILKEKLACMSLS